MILEKLLEKKGKIKKGLKKTCCVAVLSGILAGSSGCTSILLRRTGSPPHPTGATDYKGPGGAYAWRGMVYSCRTGHMDIAHIKKFARKANLHASRTYNVLKKGGNLINFHGNNPTTCLAYVTYPSNWDKIDANNKEKIINEMSIKLGQYFSHCNSICYETSGWFGFKKQPWVSEYSSAFSWEDRYSDAFGIDSAGFVIKPETNFKHSTFNKNISHFLAGKFRELNILSASDSKAAAKSVAGEWYSAKGSFWGGQMWMRNFDFGNDDGFVSPCIPKLSKCGNVNPFLVPAPNLDVAKKYGFKIDVKITGNSKGGRGMKRITGQNEIIPNRDI